MQLFVCNICSVLWPLPIRMYVGMCECIAVSVLLASPSLTPRSDHREKIRRNARALARFLPKVKNNTNFAQFFAAFIYPLYEKRWTEKPKTKLVRRNKKSHQQHFILFLFFFFCGLREINKKSKMKSKCEAKQRKAKNKIIIVRN